MYSTFYSTDATRYVMNADCTLRNSDTGTTAVIIATSATATAATAHGVAFRTDQVIAAGSSSGSYVKIKCNVTADSNFTCSGDGANVWLAFYPDADNWVYGLNNFVDPRWGSSATFKMSVIKM